MIISDVGALKVLGQGKVKPYGKCLVLRDKEYTKQRKGAESVEVYTSHK